MIGRQRIWTYHSAMNKTCRFLGIGTLAMILSSCASTSGVKSTSEKSPQASQEAIQKLIQQAGDTLITVKPTGAAPYPVHVHAPTLVPFIQAHYDAEQLNKIKDILSKSLTIKLGSNHLPKAADRFESDPDQSTKNDPTHYDAVWVRDSLWVYLALAKDHDPQALPLLRTLIAYFASPDQVQRLNAVIQNPALLQGSATSMNAVHIRFDGASPTFQDVQEGGKPQHWNHKQNDALGLFIDLYARALLEKKISWADLSFEEQNLLNLFPQYFEAAQFYAMEDAGSWEEIERTNTSSIALVTSGLERLQKVFKTLPKNKDHPHYSSQKLRKLIQLGYKTIRAQLNAGGESPAYPPNDPHYRTSDAALLNLIYPAQLSALKRTDYVKVLKIVEPLVGEVGVKRYLNDSYQAGNFWFKATANTEDTSSAQDFIQRGKQLAAHSEAQWFFDSWIALCNQTLFERYRLKGFKEAAWVHLNRALGQATGGTAQNKILGADGEPVLPLAFPESYNTIIDTKTGQRAFAPSPITPLNWAKASLRILLLQLLGDK